MWEKNIKEVELRKLKIIIGVIMASPKVGSSHVKIDVAFFGWFWLIVERGNIFCLQRPLLASSSIAEVKKERMEAIVCESFYLLLFICESFYLLLHTERATKLKPHWAL